MKLNEFKKELKELLEKYNARIDWNCADCSDLHGVTGESMGVYFMDTGKSKQLCEGSSVDAYDLK